MKDNVIMKFDTWRKFYEPFLCFCCEKEISKEQFCFSTLCGHCDLGKCGSLGSQYGHNGKRKKSYELWRKGEIVEELAVADSL